MPPWPTWPRSSRPYERPGAGTHRDGADLLRLTAAVAFGMFAASAADVAVVEVGLGGRWDATNVVDADVSVITGIDLDHTRLLGETVAEIAAEKAAILKDGGRLVSDRSPPAPRDR